MKNEIFLIEEIFNGESLSVKDTGRLFQRKAKEPEEIQSSDPFVVYIEKKDIWDTFVKGFSDMLPIIGKQMYSWNSNY